MSKVCLIRQPAGIGDIFFCQKIGYHYQSLGYKVIWPVAKVFNYIKDYIKNFEYPCIDNSFPFKDIYNSDIKEILHQVLPSDELLFIPLHGHNLRDPSVMQSKYKLVEIISHDWLSYFDFTRNIDKENDLFYNILGLKNNEEFVFLNEKYASPPNYLIKNIPLKTSKRVVKLELYNNINLFDWCKVLEQASEIYTVETSLNYLIEKLLLKTNKLEMYSKWTPSNYSQIKGIFKRKWKYNA